jgi:hypothetical protein
MYAFARDRLIHQSPLLRKCLEKRRGKLMLGDSDSINQLAHR